MATACMLHAFHRSSPDHCAIPCAGSHRDHTWAPHEAARPQQPSQGAAFPAHVVATSSAPMDQHRPTPTCSASGGGQGRAPAAPRGRGGPRDWPALPHALQPRWAPGTASFAEVKGSGRLQPWHVEELLFPLRGDEGAPRLHLSARRCCVMSLRHRPMPSGQNATRSLETGEDRAACESCTEPSTPLPSTHVNCFVAGAKHRAAWGAAGTGSVGSRMWVRQEPAAALCPVGIMALCVLSWVERP